MTGSKLVAIGSTVAVLAAIAAGLILTGSPGTQRQLRLDERRVADLRQLANTLSRYYQDTGNLPDSLVTLVDGRILTQLPHDPVTDETYGYVITSARRFQLCADFARSVESYDIDDFWSHEAGNKCFDFDFSSRRFY